MDKQYDPLFEPDRKGKKTRRTVRKEQSCLHLMIFMIC